MVGPLLPLNLQRWPPRNSLNFGAFQPKRFLQVLFYLTIKRAFIIQPIVTMLDE